MPLDCSQYHNPFTTPYACVTALDGLTCFAGVAAIVGLVVLIRWLWLR